MSSTPKTITRHLEAVLKWPRRNGDRILRADSILAMVTGNPDFPNPVPPLSQIQSNISALVISQAAAASRGSGLAARRDIDMIAVKKDMLALRMYIQSVADLSPDKAAQLIESAGFSVKKPSPRIKSDLSVKAGNDSGTVKLTGRGAGSRAAHEWQMSTDRINWKDLPVTVAAKTSVNGLTYGTTTFFRHRSVTAAGPNAWTDPVGILVS
jgi:hypothetical protein